MIVSIIGSDGRLGTSLKKVMNNRLDYVYCNSKYCDEEAIMESDVSVLAVPLTETIKILDRYYTKKLIIETCSVKTPFRKYKGHFISIHPLFGPLSYEKRKKILVIKDLSIPNYGSVLDELFPSYEFLEMDLEEHDKIMAIAQAIPYLLSLSVNVPEINIDMNSYNALKALINLRENENPDIMIDSIKLNPFAKPLIRKLLENISQFEK